MGAIITPRADTGAVPVRALPIFWLFNLAIGYLIIRTTFLPRVLGVLMALSGMGWLTVLSPDLLRYTRTYVAILGIAAEGSVMLWLLIMGVNVQRWSDQAKATAR